MTNILIALDESPASLDAARAAVRLFRGPDSRFFVVNVATVPVPWVGAAGFGAVMPMVVEPRPDLDDRRDSREDDVARLAWQAGVPEPDVEVRSGDPVSQICEAADAHDADVVVVGSHDKHALRRVFDPSVAAAVVRSTHRPVLVVSGAPPA